MSMHPILESYEINLNIKENKMLLYLSYKWEWRYSSAHSQRRRIQYIFIIQTQHLNTVRSFIYFLQRVSAALFGHHRVETHLPERPKHVVKGKTIPLRAWTSPEGSRRLRFPDFKTIGI